ncbi:MAG: hypothetical protein KDE26_05740, partial [Bacteroidetes bacterium]|nr:hypothetical protein [Bacteroidota bacterium]
GDIYRYDGSTFTVFKKEHGFTNETRKNVTTFTSNRFIHLLQDQKGSIWFATQGNGVMRFDGKHITHFTEKEGLVHNHIEHILEDSEGQLWFASGGLGTTGRGVSRYDPKDGRNGSFSNFTKAEGLSGNRVSRMLEDKSGNIWFATYDGGGASRYDGEFFTHFTTEEGMNFNDLQTIFEDSQGNLWFGTNGAGLCRFRPNSFRHFTEEQGLSANWTENLFEDRSGNIWMGTMYGGVIKYDGHTFTTYTEAEGLLQNVVVSIAEDSRGRMWFSTRDKGICRFDGKTFTNYGKAQGLSHFSWRLFIDKQDQVWVACGWGGMTRINQATGEVTHFNTETDPSGDEWEGIGGVNIYEDKHQNLWLGGRGYLAKIDPENDQIHFTHELETENKSWVIGMFEDEEDNLWVATEHHFTQITNETEEINHDFPQIPLEETLGISSLKSIVKDSEQHLWMGTTDQGLSVLVGGLDKLKNADFEQIQFSKADGLRSKRYIENGILIDHKNQIWFGSKVGPTVLDLNTFRPPSKAPGGMSLLDIDVLQHHIEFRGLSDTTYQNAFAFGKPLKQSFDSIVSFQNYPGRLTLPYDLNHLTFHFSAFDWAAPHQIKYSYKIEGLDEEWSQPDGFASADYRNLPYGTFTFKVKAIGQAGIWSEPFAYTFSIRPPWWHTWWAYALYVLLATGAVGGYILRLRRKIKEKQEQLEMEQYLNRELRELNIATTRFVPKDFVQILDKKSVKELQLGDQIKANMTVLFADIRGYTGLSENMTPEENFKFINAYLGRMGPIIQEHGGFICQYYGDGIMALFKDKHDMAVKAAIEMQKALQRYNRKRFARNRQSIDVGIGLNTGQLMLGVIGDEQRYDTSVISDVVNTAARMEGLTKIFGCQVIVSEKTLMEMNISTETKGADTLGGDYRFLGKVKVKGKEQVLKIYDFYDGQTDDIRHLKSQTKTHFEKALQLYYEREFGKAADLFKVILEEYPGDVAAKYYMDKSVTYIMGDVEDNWNGVEEMVSK